jgi:hypothetical protein
MSAELLMILDIERNSNNVLTLLHTEARDVLDAYGMKKAVSQRTMQKNGACRVGF